MSGAPMTDREAALLGVLLISMIAAVVDGAWHHTQLACWVSILGVFATTVTAEQHHKWKRRRACRHLHIVERK